VLRKNAKVELIKRVPLFSHCSKKELGAVAKASDEITVEATPDGYVQLTEFADEHATLRAWATVAVARSDVRSVETTRCGVTCTLPVTC
jgi:hypothetical protein